MHVILTTIFVQIMGPRLSLYGPLGSMAQAAEGMNFEKDQIFIGYLIMVLFFALSTLMSFWVLMNLYAASVSTAIFVLSSTFWWRHCIRIYNRFYFEKNTDFNRDSRTSEVGEDGMERHNSNADCACPPPLSPSLPSPTSQSVDPSASSTSSPATNFLRHRLFRRKISKPSNTSSSSVSAEADKGVASHFNESDTVMQGYLSTRRVANSNSPFALGSLSPFNLLSTPWSRYFFYLSSSGLLYFFASRSHWPKKPLNKRPIQLSQYAVSVHRDSGGGDDSESDSSTSTNNSRGVQYSRERDAIFELRLEYVKSNDQVKSWVLRCDTEIELQEWNNAFSLYSHCTSTTNIDNCRHNKEK